MYTIKVNCCIIRITARTLIESMNFLNVLTNKAGCKSLFISSSQQIAMAHTFLKSVMPRNNISGCLRVLRLPLPLPCLFIISNSRSYSSRSKLSFSSLLVSHVSLSSSLVSHLPNKRGKDSISLNFNSIHFKSLSRNFHKSSSFCHNTETKTKCWKCGGDTNSKTELFFCDCGVVQKPVDVTYFQLLQIKQSFDIDVKSLGQIYRNMQSRLHPDKFSTKSQVSKHTFRSRSRSNLLY